MIFRYSILSVLLVILISCNGIRKKQRHEKTRPVKTFVFNMEHMFTDTEQNVSFPIWFNDSVIKNNKIKRIVRNIYPIGDPDEFTSPKETRLYDFSEQGALLSVSIKKFYDNMTVEDVTFIYSGVKDEMGYSVVEIVNGEHQIEDEGDYAIHLKEEYLEKFLVYSNENTGNYLFYMLNKMNWGALSIDSILQPTPTDLIVLGSTFKPKKMYRVHNTVSESNVVDLSYSKDGNVIESISFEKYPFYYKRHINYDDKGYCTGFIDSTFSSDQYLTRTNNTFQMNEKHLPEKLIEKKPGGSGSEIFEYEYY